MPAGAPVRRLPGRGVFVSRRPVVVIHTMGDRLARLVEAMLRIGASLDLDAVVREVAESVRALTRARRGVVVTPADAGRAAGFVGSGFTPDERRRLAAWADGPRLFEHLLGLPGVTRLPDLPAYVASLGLSPEAPLSKIGLAAPMLHRGAPVGAVLVGDGDEGHEFSSEDDEVVELFAAQAAAAVANARAHRRERRARAEFLSMASHELRVPLASIKGSCAAVLDAAPRPEPAEMLQFFRIVGMQADQMRRVIGDLLAAGRVEAGAPSVAPAPVAVAALVDPARKTFVSGGGRHAVRIDLAPGLPRVMADRQRIVQVLNNLLANAAKHSPESFPVRVAAARDGDEVAISVSDAGRGVSPEALADLFRQRTAAAGGDRARPDAGQGLGLSICQGLVEAHGGRIWAESGPDGRGTRVVFTIPVADAVGESPAAADAAADRVGESPAAADGPDRASGPAEGRGEQRILVVDDDPLALRFARDALTEAGYAALVTGDPPEVPRLVRTKKPHLILLDLVLPGTDGIELMERIREMADVPVVFVSAYGGDEAIARALENGAADYLVKPLSPTELVARVRALLRRQAEPEPFVLADLAIHYERREVTVAGRRVELTATEYDLLSALARNAGRVLTHDALLRRVWHGRDSADARVVRAFVKILRRKLGDRAKRPAYILTERGIGYRMAGPGRRPPGTIDGFTKNTP